MKRFPRWALVATLCAVAIGCFAPTVTSLVGYPEWNDTTDSPRGVIRGGNGIYVLSRSFGRFAMARFNSLSGAIAPGIAPTNDWGYGLGDEGTPPYDPLDGPLGWVAWEPSSGGPSGGSSFTPTGFAHDSTGQKFYVTGSAVTAGGAGVAAAFSEIDQVDGSVTLNTWFSISSFYNDISGSFTPAEDIFLSGTEALVFGVASRAAQNPLLWVGNLDLQGAVDHSFGDPCIGNPSPCTGSTGFITLDTGFGGILYGDALIDGTVGYAVATGDGGAIVVGEFNVGTGSGASVWTTDGTGADSYNANAIAIQSDGKILVAGQDASDGFVIRYNTDGSRDGTFGTSGKVLFNVAGNAESYFSDMVVQTSGAILVAGYTAEVLGGDRTALSVRFSTSGTLDTTYSPTGYQLTTIAGVDNTSFDSISNGNPVGAGDADGEILLARLVAVAP